MKLAICDDSEIICEYYRSLFENAEDVEIVGIAYNGDECIDLVRRTAPDVLMLDIQMRTDDEGLTIIEDLLVINPDLKIIILTVHKVEEYVFRAMVMGAKDYISKTAEDAEVIKKVKDVYDGNVVLSSEVMDIVAKNARTLMTKYKSVMYVMNEVAKLSQSELSVLRGVYYGKTYREIAKERFVEEGTVRAQVSGILKKLGASNMRSLLKSIRKMNLFEFIDLNSPQ